MKTDIMKTGQNYVSPETACITIDVEDVLCSSIEELQYDEDWGELF